MLRVLLVLASLLSMAQFADHETFKNCRRVNFCATLSQRAPVEKYAVDASSFVLDSGDVNFLLKGVDDHSAQLKVGISRLEDSTFRVQVLDSERYQLQDVLDGEPQKVASNSTTGIFLHNAAEQWYDITNRPSDTQAYVMVESGALDLFVFLGPTPTEVVRQYVKLTGTAHLPQLWALGYHQSRWNYVSQDDVKDVVANFTTYNFPLDVIWLDTEYTDAKKYFTWDPNAFNDPVEMQQSISAAHKRLVTIIDPHIKVEQGYNVYDGALEQDLFVKRANGTTFEGDCWPGLSSYMDFLNPEAQTYYASYYSYEKFPSTTPVLAGIWNDMNEPSVFDNSLEKTLPGDALHYGGVLHRDIHNIYGLLHTKATHQGLIARDNGTTRPFVLTRSHFAGTQRYAAIWTGDNQAYWGYLRVSLSECLNANHLGIVFCGADVGGFAQDPTEELLQRWYQVGAWLPFYRAHSESGTKRREPYLFSDEVQEVMRNAIQLRYKHLPVWYTPFYEHTRNRDPIIRPLFYQYPQDTNTYILEDRLLGNGLVTIPVDIQAIPVYYRRGSVIVRKDTVRLSTDEMSDDGYTLHVNLDTSLRYNDCSETELCSQNRDLERQQRYEVLLEGAVFYQGVQNIDEEGDDIFLNITAVRGNTFRVQIEEVNSNRYHLSHVLDGPLRIREFDDVQLWLDRAEIEVGDSRAIVYFSPFYIEFYNGELLTLVIDGDRLTLQNEELRTPFTIGINFTQAAHLYGLHEHADHLALRTTQDGGYDPYRVKTMDPTKYVLYSTMALYGAIPVLYGHGSEATAGVFFHNAAEQWVEMTNTEAFFMVDSDALDIFVFLGPSIVDVVRQYTGITGVTPLPPIWTLGYHQCRWGYADQQDVQTVIAELNANDFPVDGIWLDIQHTQDYKFFTWNSENFSDPFDMLLNLSSTHRYLIALSDPHFKVEEGYFVYDYALANDYFIKNPNGTVYEDQCWPGLSAWLDYSNPEVRDWYSSLFLYENFNGTTSTLGGIWNDMNEAAIFDEPIEKTFPPDVLHLGGVPNRDIHNMYGFLQTMATHKGLVYRDNGTLRPFILTRAHFAGSQRYAAIWTGDNTGEFGFISISYAMCLNSNLLGIVFCGADIGGFYGEPSDELLQRFYQAGAWLPFFREHASLGSERREPYLFSEDVQQVIRDTMKTRYAHLPVWYTLFYEHIRNGDPVIRPIFYEYPQEVDSFEIDDQLLVGKDILVKAVSEEGAESVQVYFPGGEETLWFSAELDGTYFPGTGWTEVPVTIENIPVYYRQGGIIPVKKPGPSTADMKDTPYTLYVLLNATGIAHGTVYIDDNLSLEYRDSSKYNYVMIHATEDIVTFSTIDNSDSYGFEQVVEEIIYVHADDSGKYVKTSHKYAADGTPLSEIKYEGKNPVVVKLHV